jgi:hypothetical protein
MIWTQLSDTYLLGLQAVMPIQLTTMPTFASLRSFHTPQAPVEFEALSIITAFSCQIDGFRMLQYHMCGEVNQKTALLLSTAKAF